MSKSQRNECHNLVSVMILLTPALHFIRFSHKIAVGVDFFDVFIEY